MFLSYGRGAYYDILERTLYNALLSGLSLKGDRFFYPNPLESRGQYQRSPWFGRSCCPTNLARFIPAVGGYFYATRADTLYVNLYGANQADIPLGNREIRLIQQTDYPQTGNVLLKVEPQKSGSFTLKLRIPSWAVNQPIPSDLYTFSEKLSAENPRYSIKINGKTIHPYIEKGYAILEKKWTKEDLIELNLPMEVQAVQANHQVKDDRGKIALQRGLLVYCLEGPDHPNDQVLNLVVNPHQTFTTAYEPGLLDGITVIKGKALAAKETLIGHVTTSPVTFTAIPYYTWANRGGLEMTVWIPATIKALPSALSFDNSGTIN